MELPPSFQERLLPTEADAVDAATVDAIRLFCEATSEIEAAYVCSVVRTREGEDPERALRLSVKLVTSVDGPDDSHRSSFRLLEQFAGSCPDVMRQLGFGVLADRGVPAFERHGLKVFDRSSNG